MNTWFKVQDRVIGVNGRAFVGLRGTVLEVQPGRFPDRETTLRVQFDVFSTEKNYVAVVPESAIRHLGATE